MFNAIASLPGLAALLAIFTVGGIGALLANKRSHVANVWGNSLAAIGSAYGLLFGTAMLVSGNTLSAAMHTSSFQLFSLSLYVDRLASLFIMIISAVALCCSLYAIGYVKEYYGRYNLGQLGFLYNSFIVGMLLVVTAANGIWFLIAWEIMSLASYFLVVYDRHQEQNVKAGYVYLVMTHAGAACILLATILLYKYTHSFDFASVRMMGQAIPDSIKTVVFGLLAVGLGTKAGVIPLHIWLPSAHPAAPSHVSALMSGVMIKTGIYMMIRMFLDVLQPIPAWWGITIVIFGAASSLLGVLYALTEHDVKRLLAYHSIENIGIILLGLGAAMTFASLHRPELELLALAAALFHTLNHAVFKSLLFLGAGSVIQATHTRNIEKYGGLIKHMPMTALAFLVGSMAISALPPFNGFFSEWLTYQSLFSGLSELPDYVKWSFLFGAASLAVTGGLALACFVKAFGITFLARPRSAAASKAHESSRWMTISMAGLAALCLVLGVASGPIAALLQSVGRQITQGQASALVVAGSSPSMSVSNNHSAFVSGPTLVIALIVAAGGAWLVSRYMVYRRQQVMDGPTWDCGTPLTGRMEITATGFARSIVIIFRGLLKPTVQHTVEYDDNASRYTPSARKVSIHVHDIYQVHIYTPVYRFMLHLSRHVKRIQNGSINAYLLYLFIILVLTLLVGA